MRTFQTYFILAFVLLCTITDGYEAQSLPGAPTARLTSSHFLNMCELSHKKCVSSKDPLKCTTCKVSCNTASLLEKARHCAKISGKRHTRRSALTSSQCDQIKSKLRFATKTDEQSSDLPSVVGRWPPYVCAGSGSSPARCCEHEYYWCHRRVSDPDIVNRRCRHCAAAVDMCRRVPGKVAVFNSNLTGPERASIASQTLNSGNC